MQNEKTLTSKEEERKNYHVDCTFYIQKKKTIYFCGRIPKFGPALACMSQIELCNCKISIGNMLHALINNVDKIIDDQLNGNI